MFRLTLHISDPLSLFPAYLFPFFLQTFPVSLGPNELSFLLFICSQMCCHSCQCSAMMCDTNTHKLIHRGLLPAHQNSNEVSKSFHPTLIPSTTDCLMLQCPVSSSPSTLCCPALYMAYTTGPSILGTFLHP